ncbi:MAG: shikimate dehydrogenase [Myxococcota bacterium]|nr:shikimate dehydrogenase [Myxococcota bacterium]MDW8362809.1 shikimate dehydrogenase [Myxococcales bacterium]
MTALYGVLGWPVAHSLSPAMFRAAFDARGLDAVYARFEVAPERLDEAVRGLRVLGIAGVNVTAPCKERITAWLDALEPAAARLGACNVVTREGDRLVGGNTDVEGLRTSLAEHGIDLRSRAAVVVGAGGVARAAVAALLADGAGRVTVVARRIERAAALVEDLARRGITGPVDVAALGDDRHDAMRDASLLVQATSATVEGSGDAEAFVRALGLDALRSDAIVVETVYRPRRTSVLVAAASRGLRTIDGLGMLLHQAAATFARWTGRPAPLEAMRAALERACERPPSPVHPGV